MEFVKKQNNIKIVVTISVLLALVIGLVILLGTISNTKNSVYELTDEHLIDMANIIDGNVQRAMNRCCSELQSIASADIAKRMEEEYVTSGNFSHLRNKFNNSNVITNGYAIDILVKTGSVVESGMERDVTGLDFSNQRDDGTFWFSIDSKTNNAYLMVSIPSNNVPDFSYIIMVDYADFYDRVVLKTVVEEYWTVIYDESNNLIIQTSQDGSGYLFMTRGEMEQRSDGYLKIINCETNGNTEIANYTMIDNDGVKDIRMYVKSSHSSTNGVYAIAVAMSQNEINSEVRSWSISFFIASLLIMGSICISVFYALHSGERERELANEIRALERENELIDNARKSQEEVYHLKRLETLGTLTAGIAHEFNNMLAPIMADSLLAIEKIPEDNTEVYDNLVDIYNSSRKAKELVSRITRLSRKTSETNMKDIDSEKLIDDTISIISASLPKNITIEKTIRTNKHIIGSENQLGYMFVNIILNAAQAMEDNGGIISISVEERDDFVAFIFDDEGPGIPENVISSIFDPFYTTKAAGKGTGLGLSIAANTVADHGGSIEAENREGGGARFTVLLKAVKDQE